MSINKSSNHLKDIKKNEMSSVVFIRDYIQLIFENDEETIVTFYAP
ncbi:hypothetical protein H1230_16280 [Paenibacillus sp. 19GGS1-52]|nr:hypothetical protein [Paenibacillus sp. 19GGS1-52]ULO04725.1 hypothetical protein H1230_16280 [Paenibacillus sp. 19GGS1-52]